MVMHPEEALLIVESESYKRGDNQKGRESLQKIGRRDQDRKSQNASLCA